MKTKVGQIPAEFCKIDIFKLFSYFLVSGFIGWVFETLMVWVLLGQLTDRGFLFIMQPLGHYLPFLAGVPVLGSIPFVWGLPVILIYGLGGMAMCSLFKRWEKRPVLVFFIGMAVLTLLELVASYVCEGLLHVTYWDYSSDFMNFQGRICLRSSLVWGALSVVAVKFFAPLIDRLYMRVRARRFFKVIVTALVVYVAVCAVVKYAIDPNIIPNVVGV